MTDTFIFKCLHSRYTTHAWHDYHSSSVACVRGTEFQGDTKSFHKIFYIYIKVIYREKSTNVSTSIFYRTNLPIDLWRSFFIHSSFVVSFFPSEVSRIWYLFGIVMCARKITPWHWNHSSQYFSVNLNL